MSNVLVANAQQRAWETHNQSAKLAHYGSKRLICRLLLGLVFRKRAPNQVSHRLFGPSHMLCNYISMWS